jgi:hypothetical protein
VRNIDSGTINGEYCGLLSSKRRVDAKKKREEVSYLGRASAGMVDILYNSK